MKFGRASPHHSSRLGREHKTEVGACGLGRQRLRDTKGRRLSRLRSHSEVSASAVSARVEIAPTGRWHFHEGPLRPCARLTGFVCICQVTVGRAYPANREMASRRALRSSEAHADARARTTGYTLRYGRLLTRLLKHLHPQIASGAFAWGGDCACSPTDRWRFIWTRRLEGHWGRLRRGLG
jgi:hypothetical protein